MKSRNQHRTDRDGNLIGDGKYHVDYDVYDFSEMGYDFIESNVSLSESTESVYVYYTNTKNHKIACVRFSWHNSNDSMFGDVLCFTDIYEILYRLDLAERTFVHDERLFIGTQQIKKSELDKYEEAELTIREMYDLGEGADLSKYVGKRAKGSNYLVFSDQVKKFVLETGQYKYQIR